jgi:hypothetical protein
LAQHSFSFACTIISCKPSNGRVFFLKVYALFNAVSLLLPVAQRPVGEREYLYSECYCVKSQRLRTQCAEVRKTCEAGSQPILPVSLKICLIFCGVFVGLPSKFFVVADSACNLVITSFLTNQLGLISDPQYIAEDLPASFRENSAAIPKRGQQHLFGG